MKSDERTYNRNKILTEQNETAEEVKRQQQKS